MGKSFHITLYMACVYLSMLGFKSISIKKVPSLEETTWRKWRDKTGHVDQQPLLGLLSWHPPIKSSICNSFENEGLLSIKSTGTQSSNELQRLDLTIGYQDDSPNTHFQACLIGQSESASLFTHKRELLLTDLRMSHTHSMQSKPSVIMNGTE